MNTKKEKKILRNVINARISKLERSYIEFSDKKIFKNIIFLHEFRDAKTVFIFASTKNEVETFEIIKYALDKKKNVVLPVCIEEGVMEARKISGIDDLSEGKYGIMEPNKSCPIVERKEIDLAIIPCVSCNYRGERLGHGGGYYDRFIRGADFKKVVICRKKLILDKIPMGFYDVKMDIIVSENKIKKIK